MPLYGTQSWFVLFSNFLRAAPAKTKSYRFGICDFIYCIKDLNVKEDGDTSRMVLLCQKKKEESGSEYVNLRYPANRFYLFHLVISLIAAERVNVLACAMV